MNNLSVTEVAERASFEKRIDDYFSSIGDSFELTLSIPEPDYSQGAVFAVFIACTLFTLIPIIPSMVWFALTRFEWVRTVQWRGVTVPFRSFWFWYFTLSIAMFAGALIAGWLDSRTGQFQKVLDAQMRRQSKEAQRMHA